MIYNIVYGCLYAVSLLPFWVLYGISDFAFFILYHIIKYRKDVVMGNLDIAFPEKSTAEKKRIARQFYKNLCDSFIETIKLLSISESTLKKRILWDETVLNNRNETRRQVQLHLSHVFNWEYANLILSLKSIYQVLIVYMPVTNSIFEKLFIKIRTRFQAKMIAATHYRRDFLPYSKEKYCLVFVADQNAGATNTAYWSNFFNKPAPFVTGPEKSARLNNSLVFFVDFLKLKRGFYKVVFKELTDAPRNLKEGELTKRLIRETENAIRANPANYLWSHRRWKHEFDSEKHSKLLI